MLTWYHRPEPRGGCGWPWFCLALDDDIILCGVGVECNSREVVVICNEARDYGIDRPPLNFATVGDAAAWCEEHLVPGFLHAILSGEKLADNQVLERGDDLVSYCPFNDPLILDSLITKEKRTWPPHLKSRRKSSPTS